MKKSWLGDCPESKHGLRGRHGKGAGHLQAAFNAKHPVVCMDVTPWKLLRETRDPTPAVPSGPERHDYEYERCGVCNVFMASEPLAGRLLSKVTERRTKLDLAVFGQDIAASYPDAERITLVMDLPEHAHAGLAV